ncbi:STAS domain-containing protein [Paracoccus xiamenensis]|uniref:STAS domain-containing protein n=1 Tax=Paracoccus xiamenensis TaxID=2714901 RepID=UPI00140CBA37|nr:STAS domain-containing protein [Paracoccus xiamenensis]NHF73218.1 STAS domain-containing protein [Paracoccus xiamenensis]
MAAQLTLPARLDLTAAKPLAREISALVGDVELDASGVTHLGGLCLQVLLAAAQSFQISGRSFAISSASEEFQAALSMFGVDPAQLPRKATA